MSDTTSQAPESDDELDAMLRQMYAEHPAPAAPADLARRARRLATQVTRAELERLERIRRWAFGVTLAAAVVIFYLILNLATGLLTRSGLFSSTNISSSNTWSSGTQLLVIIAATGAAVALGVLLIGPALSANDQ